MFKIDIRQDTDDFFCPPGRREGPRALQLEWKALCFAPSALRNDKRELFDSEFKRLKD